ncbi:MAG TPA: hypothetical protein VKB46_06445 [Pyrinomonadaceae bacterium]|nr:hypothetical protein [Pyrinomonadaceae bacterium]
MLIQRKKQTPDPATATQTKLHSIHGLLRGRAFEGQFVARAKTYRFAFNPTTAAIVDQKLTLSGRLRLNSSQGEQVVLENVNAKLLATQGGVGGSPVRRQLLTGTAQTAQTSTSEQKMEQERGPETELQPGLHAFESPKSDSLGRPNVESTDTQAFVGVLYFQLSPLSSQALRIPLDMSAVQLNGRLAPTDDVARDLQLVFSDLVLALGGKQPDESTVQQNLEVLNRIFKS